MPQVDPVILQLRADVQDYNTRIEKAERLTTAKLDAIETKGFEMGQNLKKGFSLASAAASAFVASIVVDKLLSAAGAGLEYASALGETAQQLGVTTDALQEYRYVAEQVGLEQSDMEQGLVQLNRRIGEAATGNKAQAESFQKLGISVRDASGEIRRVEEVIPLIAEGLQSIESPAERTAILMDLMGRAAAKWAPAFEDGAEGVRKLTREAHEFGTVLTPEQIRNADAAADSWARVKRILSTSIAKAVAENAGAIEDLANSIAGLITKLANLIGTWSRYRNMSNEIEATQSKIRARTDIPVAGRTFLSEKAREQVQAKNGYSSRSAGGIMGALGLRIGGFQSGVQNTKLAGDGFGLARDPLAGFSGSGVAGGLEAISEGLDEIIVKAPRASEAMGYILDETKGFAPDDIQREIDLLIERTQELKVETKNAAAEAEQVWRDVADYGMESLSDGIANAILGAENLGDVFKRVSQQIIADLLKIAIQKTITNSLGDALLGGLGSLFGGGKAATKGRASGGSVSAGQFYRVNEAAAAGRVEGFIPQGSGTIVPLGRMNGVMQSQGSGGLATVRLELSQDLDARIINTSGQVAVEVVRGASPAIIDASAREASARARRPSL